MAPYDSHETVQFNACDFTISLRLVAIIQLVSKGIKVNVTWCKRLLSTNSLSLSLSLSLSVLTVIFQVDLG